MPAVATVTFNPALDIATRTARVLPSHKLRCEAPLLHPGGGGINVARALHRLGVEALALHASGGPTGQRLQALLRAEGLAQQAVAVAGDTRESFHVVETATGQELRFVLPGPALAAAEWQAVLDAAAALQPAPAWVVGSGSLPPGVPDDAWARLVRAARARGRRVAIDASGAPLAQALQAGVDLAKPSLRELRELTGQDLPDLAAQRTAAMALVASGQAGAVALSLGAGGALLATAEGCWQAEALPVAVASTSGAGDSFLAGLLAARLQGEAWPQALAGAIAAGTAALLAQGTALCDPVEVARLRPQVRVQAV
jgi:6-phosphofructokinase 2